MDINGRFETIEDALSLFHHEQWFAWSDPNNKIYANLVVTNSDVAKPTEKEVTDALAKQQSDFDAQEYARNRQAEYPSIAELTVALYDTSDKAALVAKRAAVKTKWPKDNSGPV